MQVSQNQYDFRPEFAATVANSRWQRQVDSVRQIANVVSQIDGFAIDDSPRGLEAMVSALIAINAFRKDFNRIADEMFFGFSGLATGGFLWRLFIGILFAEFVAIKAVILREDRLLRRFGIDFCCQQCFQSFDSLFELLVLFFQLLIFFGQLGNRMSLLSDLQIPWISFSCCGVRHDARVTNLSILRNPNRKWAATLAGLGELDKARQDLQKISAQDPNGYYQQYQTALLSLKLEDLDGYKSACQKILETTRETDPPIAKHFAAWTCALAPNAVDDYTGAIALGRAAVEAEPANPQFLNGLGAILMRAGLDAEAKPFLEGIVNNPGDENTSKTYTYSLLAMTEHHLGNAEAARTHLTTANELADKELAGSIPWNRRLTIELLRTEAQGLVGEAGN